jgi:MSHA pilin protein MshC
MPRPNHAKRPPRRSAFTILEAVVVIVVIGILFSVAAPRFLAMSSFNASQAHRQALSDLRFAQRRAMSSGCPVQVDFSTTGYTVTQRTSCRTGTFTQPLVDPTTNQAPFAITLAGVTSISSTVDPLIFDTIGRVTTTAGVTTNATITVGGRTLQAVGETGLVRVP